MLRFLRAIYDAVDLLNLFSYFVDVDVMDPVCITKECLKLKEKGGVDRSINIDQTKYMKVMRKKYQSDSMLRTRKGRCERMGKLRYLVANLTHTNDISSEFNANILSGNRSK